MSLVNWLRSNNVDVKEEGQKHKENEHWKYYPRHFNDPKLETQVYEELKHNFRGRNHRKSCLLATTRPKLDPKLGYTKLHFKCWDTCPILLAIKTEVEKLAGVVFDYVLVHDYPDGRAAIDWHNDKESLDNVIVSVSFFTSREFLINDLNNPDEEKVVERLTLNSGDVLFMNSKMQRLYWHKIKKDLKIKERRIVLTFRRIQNSTTLAAVAGA